MVKLWSRDVVLSQHLINQMDAVNAVGAVTAQLIPHSDQITTAQVAPVRGLAQYDPASDSAVERHLLQRR